jgi:hypothetical protein
VLVELPQDEDLREHTLAALRSGPSVLHAAMPGEGKDWPDVGADTLLLLSVQDVPGLLRATGSLPHRVLTRWQSKPRSLEPDDPVIAMLAAWGAKQPAGWDLPGSPQRKAIRAALGGRLVEWLRRLER